LVRRWFRKFIPVTVEQSTLILSEIVDARRVLVMASVSNCLRRSKRGFGTKPKKCMAQLLVIDQPHDCGDRRCVNDAASLMLVAPNGPKIVSGPPAESKVGGASNLK
jgi:hypothetical protein